MKASKEYATKKKAEMVYNAIMASLQPRRGKEEINTIQEVMEICYRHGYEQAAFDITGRKTRAR
jgi:hypothetical protein